MTDEKSDHDKLEGKQKEHTKTSSFLGRVVHSEPLQAKLLSEALGKLPQMDLKK